MHSQKNHKTVTLDMKSKTQSDIRKVDIHFLIPEKKLDIIQQFVFSNGGTISDCQEGEEADCVPWRDALPNAHYGNALRGLRVREGLTQKELAEKLGIEQSHVSAMEHAKRPIGKTLAKKIAEMFGSDYLVFL